MLLLRAYVSICILVFKGSYSSDLTGGALAGRCMWSLFIGLYVVYGVIFGLTTSVRQLVGEGAAAPPVLEGTLSLSGWVPLFAVLVAPLVEAMHVPYVGRRKTWIRDG